MTLSVAEHLDELRALFPECFLAAFADIGSGMVLSFSAAERPPQEVVDALAAEVQRDMGPGLQEVLGWASGSDDAAVLSVHSVSDHLRIVVRTSGGSTEVICALCKPGLDLQSFVAATRERLEAMEGSE
ncbi:MAG: hypothetical protein AAFX00_09960 [Pseudomonadota bacterium]